MTPIHGLPIFPAIAKAWHELSKELLDNYRPELHYMREPGPKWRKSMERRKRSARSSGRNEE
jgi:hypothetical protein